MNKFFVLLVNIVSQVGADEITGSPIAEQTSTIGRTNYRLDF